MLQANRILTFVDSESASQAALEHATQLALTCDATLLVMPLPAYIGAAVRPSVAARDDARAHEGISKIATSRSVPTPSYEMLPASSDVDELVRRIEDADVDLIVTDTPADRGPIPMLASEPVASIARRTSLPLFTVGHRLTNDPIRRILLPTDFSEHARDALAHAKALAHAYAASLDVLHVLERPQYVALNATDMLAMSDATLPERKARRRIETFLGTVNGSPVDTRIHVDHGDVADCIGHFADQHATDLVVLSTHGVIGQPTRPLGSVAEKVLRRIARPTFLTRAFGRSAAEPASSMSSDGAAGGTPRVDPKLS